MKKSVFIILLAGVSVLGQMAPRAPARSEADNGSVSGQILDGDTGEPVAGLSVRAVETGQGEGTKSDAKGKYTIAAVSSGKHSILVDGERVWPDLGSAVAMVEAGKETAHVDLRVWQDGAVAGRVTDQNKDPIAGMPVHLIGREYYAGAVRYFSDGTAITDDRGRYSFSLVRSHRAVLVLAEMKKTYASPVSDAPADPARRRPAYQATFYPGGDSVGSASLVTLRSGEHRDSVDIVMLRSQSYCVEATLLLNGTPASMNFKVTDERTGSANMTPGSSSSGPPGVASGPDGRIRICDLYPGQFRIVAFRGRTGNSASFGAATVTIDKSDVSKVTVSAADAMQIAGETAWDGAPPDGAGQAQIQFRIQAVTNDAMPAPSARPAIPGQFSFMALPSVEYLARAVLIGAGGLPNAYIKDVTYGGLSVLHQALKAPGALPDAAVRVVVANDGGFVKATVNGKDGQPVPGAGILLLPDDVASEAILADAIVSGQADAAGSYASAVVRPGKYFVLATNDLVDNTPESMDRVWQARRRGRAIEVVPNATVQAVVEVMKLD